jgi:hypothetical protein
LCETSRSSVFFNAISAQLIRHPIEALALELLGQHLSESGIIIGE